MRKVLRFMMDDGLYELPVAPIAHNRAKYYADFDTAHIKHLPEEVFQSKWQEVYSFEYNMLMEEGADTYDIIDWLLNNMNWEDIESEVVKISDRPVRPMSQQWNSIQGSEHFEVLELE